MTSVNEKLATDYGLMLCAPPYENIPCAEVRSIVFNKGVKENCGIFNHTQGWAVMAETMLGHGNRAFKYFRSSMPASFNDKAEIRGSEPYVYSQYTHSIFSPRYGASRVPWLTGAASWAYYAATQYILGIRPDYKGLLIDPCIPAKLEGIHRHPPVPQQDAEHQGGESRGRPERRQKNHAQRPAD